MTGDKEKNDDLRRELEPIEGERAHDVEPSAEQAAAKAVAAENDVQSLRAAVHEANERALRSHAELENFRKRARREMEEERRYAAMPLVRDLLPVLDNLERAIEAAGKSETAAGLLDGVRMVSQQLSATLAQHHCRRINAVGQPFDPNLHEAVGQEPTAEFPAGTVCREVRSGYLLQDRVIRPSQVFVAAAPTEASDDKG